MNPEIPLKLFESIQSTEETVVVTLIQGAIPSHCEAPYLLISHEDGKPEAKIEVMTEEGGKLPPAIIFPRPAEEFSFRLVYNEHSHKVVHAGAVVGSQSVIAPGFRFTLNR